MPSVARIGDIGTGVCVAHESPKSIVTNLVTGASTVLTNSLGTTTAITIGTASCGHVTTAVTYSTTVFAEKQGIHRVNDMGIPPAGNYTVVIGSPNVNAGG